MKNLRLIKELKKHNESAVIRAHGQGGFCVVKAIQFRLEPDVIILLDEADTEHRDYDPHNATVKGLIEQLYKYNPNAEIKMHEKDGNNVLFVVSYVGNDDFVILEDKTDSDLSSELEARFTYASENQIDELDFFMDLLETGFTLEDIKTCLPDRYNYTKEFMEEHGLV